MEQQKEWGKRLLQLAVTLACLLATSASQAGPPFVTDDPEPVDYRAGEFYLSSQYASTRDGKSGTAPHLEVNYGIAPETQAHILLPLAFNRPSGGPTTFGIGDLEAGVKYRFLHETETSPQVGIFPLVHIPTGESRRGLGTGHVPVLLPIWAQKSWEPYTTYGGGGYWINPGSGSKNFWQFGVVGQRDVGKTATVGTEIYYFSRDASDTRDRAGYNIGGVFNISDHHHLMAAAGSDFSGDTTFSLYVGYLWTFGGSEGVPKTSQSHPP